MKRGTQLLLVAGAFLLAMVVADECIYKECYCFGVAISCSNKGLPELPEKDSTVKTPFETLDLGFNMITWIPNGGLPPNLEQIIFDGNPIEQIEDLAFNDSATTLETLSFSSALFSRIPDAFLTLKNLTSFTIYDSKVADWNENAMIGLGKTLKTLSIQNCSLNAWPTWIQNLTHLIQLTLSDNFIASVPDDALDNVVNSLASLSIANNRLTNVPKALSKLLALDLLSMEKNKITDVSSLPKGSNLTSISIHTNYIFDSNQLSTALFPYATTLRLLVIDNNRLISIPELAPFTKIGALDLSQNRMSDPNSGSLPPLLYTLGLEGNAFPLIPRALSVLRSVTDLSLSLNSLKQIRAVDFPQWVVGAQFDNNLITELTDSCFPENSSLLYLHLSNNPISRISKNTFKNVPNLFELVLRYTRLTRLPLEIGSMTNLHAIDFTGSVLLVCTCQEKSLQTWITSLYSGNVVGDCGLTSIYYFYIALSPHCPA